MRTAHRIQSSKKSKIPKHRILNKSQYKYKALKTQKGGAAAAAAAPKTLMSNTLLTGTKVSGNTSAERIMMSRVQPILDTYQSVKTLVEKIFAGNNIKYFKLDGSMPDPFIKLGDHPFIKLGDRDGFTPSFYLDWYKSKNPHFKTHAELEADGIDFDTKLGLDGDSIYETMMAQICRDLLIMIYTRKRNMNNNARDSKVLQKMYKKYLEELESLKQMFEYNADADIETEITELEDKILILETPESSLSNTHKTKLKSLKNNLELQTENDIVIDDSKKQHLYELLQQCDDCIRNGYKYSDVFNIIYEYIRWISYARKHKNGIISFETASAYFLKSKTLFFEFPYIIFPTYIQISYKYVLYLMCAPIINFRLINRARNIHGYAGAGIIDWYHDIGFHGNKTHQIDLLSQKYTTDKYIYTKWFENMSSVLSILYQYFNYNKLTIDKISNFDKTQIYNELNDDEKKQIIAILLFILFHEGIFEDIYLFYHLYFNTDLTTLKLNRTSMNLDIIYTTISRANDWPKNINVKSVIVALNAIFDTHKEKLDAPMKNLGDILGLQLPSQRPPPLPQPQ
jgi:Fe-S cluster biosynthesis and repair protein YggX